jgi:hypothetical protein
MEHGKESKDNKSSGPQSSNGKATGFGIETCHEERGKMEGENVRVV